MKHTIDEFYTLKTLGSGTFATAYLACHKQRRDLATLKVMSEDTLMSEEYVK